MKQFLAFIAGMVAGALLLYAIGFRSENSVKAHLKQELIENLSQNLKTLDLEAGVQFLEVKGKKGNVTLHTGMPKDSVKIIVGKPDKVDLRSLGSTTYETWGYKLKNNYVSDLDIEFEDGKLKNVRQE